LVYLYSTLNSLLHTAVHEQLLIRGSVSRP